MVVGIALAIGIVTQQLPADLAKVRCSVTVDGVHVTAHAAMRQITLVGNGRPPVQGFQVEFEPLALRASRVDPRAFYVAGHESGCPVLERWILPPPAAATRTQAQSAKAALLPPEPPREVLFIDPALRYVSDLAIDPRSPDTLGADELWALEYGTGDVYRLDTRTGTKTLVLSGEEAGPQRSLDLRRHGESGLTCTLRRNTRTPSCWIPDFRLLDLHRFTDQDGDGIFEQYELIPFGRPRED